MLIVAPYFGGLKDGNPDVVDLAVELQKNGHNVTALTTRWKNEAYQENVQGVHVIRATPMLSLPRLDYDISFPLATLRRLIRKNRVEVVHGIMEFGALTLSAAAVSSALKKPYVLTIQGAVTTFGSTYVDATFSIFDRTVVNTLSFVPRRIIVLSKSLSERAAKIGIHRDLIRVIPSGIHCEDEFNPAFFRAESERKKLRLQGKIVVGFVGRLVRLKGVVFLLQAMRALQSEFPRLHLVIVGDGPDRFFIEETARKLNLNVTMTGWVKRRELAHVLSTVDIFANPSLTEGLPISVMEAMSMQKPVVATNVGGTQDLVRDGKNGYLVPPFDVSALSAAVQKLLKSPSMRLKMGQTGRQIIEKEFSFSSVASKVSEVYKEAMC